MEAILVKIVNVKIANIRSCIVCVLDDWVLNTHLWFLIVIIYIVLIVSMCILLFQNFQDCDVVEDCSFDSYRTEVLIMQNPVHWFALQTWKELRSFFIFEIRIFFSFWTQSVFVPCVWRFCYWFYNRAFYEMAICYIIVIKS